MNIDGNKMLKAFRLRNIGWSIYLVECADKSYFAGMTRNMKKELNKINVLREGKYFNKHPERIPVTIVFEDKNLPFREAYAKYCYLKDMNRRQRTKLIKLKKWNDSWHLYRMGVRSIPRICGYA
jgi:predicted GIY-YIG superfamily endonuclease